MNVFVLCTGRTGSESFARACSHITNYSAGHETRAHCIGGTRLDYPPDHIEADNRLTWFLGGLDDKYGNKAIYVHLKRRREAVIASFNRRWDHSGSIIKAFGSAILLRNIKKLRPEDRLKICGDYVDTVNENITSFLKDKDHKLVVELEKIDVGFRDFWELIGAEGDFPKALKTFEKRTNVSGKKNFWRMIGLRK